LNPKKQNSLEKQKKRKKIYRYDCHHLPFTNHTKDITVKIMDLAPNLVSNHEKESAGAKMMWLKIGLWPVRVQALVPPTVRWWPLNPT